MSNSDEILVTEEPAVEDEEFYDGWDDGHDEWQWHLECREED